MKKHPTIPNFYVREPDHKPKYPGYFTVWRVKGQTGTSTWLGSPEPEARRKIVNWSDDIDGIIVVRERDGKILHEHGDTFQLKCILAVMREAKP